MGLADYMSRNPSKPAQPPSTYDESFIIAQIKVIKETLQIIRKKGRPKKPNNNKTQHCAKTTHNESNDIKTKYNGTVQRFQQFTKLPNQTTEMRAQKS